MEKLHLEELLRKFIEEELKEMEKGASNVPEYLRELVHQNAKANPKCKTPSRP